MHMYAPTQDQVNRYVCACASGFSGQSCETNIDDCESNPCQNGGACMVSTTHHTHTLSWAVLDVEMNSVRIIPSQVSV